MIGSCDPGNGCIGSGPTGREPSAGDVADFLARARGAGDGRDAASDTLADDRWWANETGRLPTDQFGSSINGGGGPWWVELTLAAPADVSRFSLRVAQDPPGRSTHELWVERAGGTGVPLHVFDGVTRENEVLEWVPGEPITDVVVVRVVTTSLDGGLAPAWHEIELFSTEPPSSG